MPSFQKNMKDNQTTFRPQTVTPELVQKSFTLCGHIDRPYRAACGEKFDTVYHAIKDRSSLSILNVRCGLHAVWSMGDVPLFHS